MRRPVQRLADDLLRRRYRQVGELLAELGDSAVALQLDLAARPLQHRLLLLLRLLSRLLLQPLPHPLRLRDDLLALAARRLQLLLSQAVRLDLSLAALLRGRKPGADALPALVQHPQHRLIDEESQDDEQQSEVDQLPHEQGQVDADVRNAENYHRMPPRFGLRSLRTRSRS